MNISYINHEHQGQKIFESFQIQVYYMLKLNSKNIFLKYCNFQHIYSKEILNFIQNLLLLLHWRAQWDTYPCESAAVHLIRNGKTHEDSPTFFIFIVYINRNSKHTKILPLFSSSLLAPSGVLIAIPAYYWSPPPAPTFRIHRSSTLDFHFLSHYIYI